MVYVSAANTLAAATNASAGKADVACGIYNGSGLVPNGHLVDVAKSTGESWNAGDVIYLGSDSKGTKTAPTAAGTWQKVIGIYQGANSNTDATGRVILCMEPAVQNL